MSDTTDNEQAILTIAEYAVTFGLDAAIAIAKAIQKNSIEDAIAALEAAKVKTAQDYLEEAKLKVP